MKIELRKLSTNERMSEETTMFVADLYINGKKVGYCKNSGQGGCTDIHGDSRENNQLINEAEAYCKSLPKIKCFDMELEQNLELTIDMIVEEHLKAKERKKMEKNMAYGILYGIPNGVMYNTLKYKQPLSEIVKTHRAYIQQKLTEIKTTKCKDGVVILNTNLEALGLTL